MENTKKIKTKSTSKRAIQAQSIVALRKMYMLLFLLFTTVVLLQLQQTSISYAQSIPSPHCLGSCPKLAPTVDTSQPTISLGQNGNPTPTIYMQSPVTSSSPVPSASPSQNISPSISINPCMPTVKNNKKKDNDKNKKGKDNDKKHSSGKQGLLQQLLQILLQLLQQIFQQLGIKIPNPCPTPTPSNTPTSSVSPSTTPPNSTSSPSSNPTQPLTPPISQNPSPTLPITPSGPQPSPTLPLLPSPTSTLTPTPTISPGAICNQPSKLANYAWGGYQYIPPDVPQSITTDWKVPSSPVCPAGVNGYSIWPGISGYGYLIQVGTYYECKTNKYFGWTYTWSPTYPTPPLTPLPTSDSVKPGDTVRGKVTETSPGNFTLTIQNVTLGWSYSVNWTAPAQVPSSQRKIVAGEIEMEDEGHYLSNGTTAPLSQFSQINFSNTTFSLNGGAQQPFSSAPQLSCFNIHRNTTQNLIQVYPPTNGSSFIIKWLQH